MPDSIVKILLIDDDEDDFVLARELLDEIPGADFEVDWVQDYDRALKVLESEKAQSRAAAGRRTGHDACLVDFRLGPKDGISFIREARQRDIHLPIILLTGQGDHEIDLAAMNAGAADFLDKSHLTADMLERSLRYAIYSSRIESQRARLLAVAEQQAAQLRHLATELTQAEQRERRRIAQTLHDHLQQLLVAAKMRVDRLRTRSSDESLGKAVGQVQELIAESIEASRSLTMQLSPPVLHDRGLIPALEWLSRQFAKEHDLSVQVVADEPLEVVDDHIRDFLFQAVRELLFNVVKHAHAQEAVVTVRRSGRSRLEVTVRDNGRGWDTGLLSDRRANEGFGLFHLQQRIEFLGGRFKARSKPGNGCEISLSVPISLSDPATRRPDTAAADAADPARDPSPRSDADPADRSGEAAVDEDIRVLLVDDHKILREGLAGLLHEQPGIRIVGEASDGQMAVDLCLELRPDIVVMDITMPGMSGIEATRAIKKQCPGVDVIGLSMHETADVGAAMREAGASDYFRKDDPAEGLIAAILQRATDSAAASPDPL